MDQPLADWSGLIGLLTLYVIIVAALVALGRGPLGLNPNDWVRRIAAGLERVTKIPAWAAAMIGTASFGLLVAGMGFYNDVAWHVELGRDEVLFTAPHTAIVVGLGTIFASAVLGEWFATATRAGVGVEVLGRKIPRSALVMGAIGASALAGFPLDELWHRQYGIDVTMWSPTHLLMIIGASISPLASWLALGEAGVRAEPRASDGDRVARRWAVGLHVAVGTLALLGLTSVQGEFSFGVPQFQHLYHPVLYAFAAGFALVAVTVATRRWWAPLVVAAIGAYVGAGDSFAGEAGSEPRAASTYLVAAVVVALVAKLAGTERLGRFVALAGVGIGTLGLAGEWAWSQGGWQPWRTTMLPEAAIWGLAMALGAAVLGAAFATGIRRAGGPSDRIRRAGGPSDGVRREASRLPAVVIVVAGLVVLAGLAWPLPRHGSDVRAEVSFDRRDDMVSVTARLSPPDAAEDARWFQAIAWQGGDFQRAEMVPAGDPGVYRSEQAVPFGGSWKTMLRLHRGTEMVAIPIWLPADPEIGAGELAVEDRETSFVAEQRYLLREQVEGPPWFAIVVYLLLAGMAFVWVTGMILTVRSMRPSSTAEDRDVARV